MPEDEVAHTETSSAAQIIESSHEEVIDAGEQSPVLSNTQLLQTYTDDLATEIVECALDEVRSFFEHVVAEPVSSAFESTPIEKPQEKDEADEEDINETFEGESSSTTAPNMLETLEQRASYLTAELERILDDAEPEQQEHQNDEDDGYAELQLPVEVNVIHTQQQHEEAVYASIDDVDDPQRETSSTSEQTQSNEGDASEDAPTTSVEQSEQNDDNDDDDDVRVEDNDEPTEVHNRLVSERTMSDMWDWRLTESERQLGKVKPYWIPDEDANACMLCSKPFTIIRRRHHCRSCGRLLCQECTKSKYKLSYLEGAHLRIVTSTHKRKQAKQRAYVSRARERSIVLSK